MTHKRTVNGSFSRHETPWGCMKDIASQFHVYIRDYQGNILTCLPHGDAVNNTDPTGKDIVVLGQPLHMAMLIQNSEKKWQYYSINGNNVYISGIFSGGRPFNDVGVGSWLTPEEFINSSYNINIGDAGKENPNVNNYGFKEGYRISTTEKQDEIMRGLFEKISETDYSLLHNNCATAVQVVMFRAEVPINDYNPPKVYVKSNVDNMPPCFF